MFGRTDELLFVVDLSKPVKRRILEPLFFTEDNAGTTIVLSLCDEHGSAVSAADYSAELNFIRPDGVTVLIPGVITGSTASFTLAAACLEAPGGAEMHASLNAGTTRKTVWSADAVIHRTATNSYADPTNIIPNISALIAQYDACVTATNNANNAVAAANAAVAANNAQMAILQSVIEQAVNASHSYVQATAPTAPEEGDLWFVTSATDWDTVAESTWNDVSAGTWRDLANPSVTGGKVYIVGDWVNMP